MKEWMIASLPEGADWFELPSLEERRGSARLAEVAAIVGAEGAKLAAQRAGPYLLADSLVRELQLQGIALAEEGELPALSPPRWRPALEQGLPENAQVLGIHLSSSSLAAFTSFLGAARPESAAGLVELAEHFFYRDSLKVALRYTGPRFNHK